MNNKTKAAKWKKESGRRSSLGIEFVGRRGTRKNEEIDWYINESGSPLVIITQGTFKDFLVLRRDVYDNLENMFGLDTTDDIQAHLRKYFYTKWGIETDIIYTFEPGNEGMV